jgi:hypothetical protein
MNKSRPGHRIARGVRVLSVLLLWQWGQGIILAQETPSQGFIFLPFQNSSDFAGRWDVGVDVPRFLAAFMKERYRIPTVSPAIVRNFFEEQKHEGRSFDDVRFWDALYNTFKIRFLVAGVVEQFEVSRFVTGQPLVGGYEAFKGSLNISFSVFDLERTAQSATASPIKRALVTGEYADRSLTLTLFGKQSDRTVEYRDLDKIRFGSEDFNRTVIGQACFQAAENFAMEIESAMPVIKAWGMSNPDSLLRFGQMLDSISLSFKPMTIWGAIVFIEGESAFINLGSEDGIRPGQQLLVYKNLMAQEPALGAIGELNVSEVRGPHLSLARIVKGQRILKARDRISVTLVR